MPCPSGIRAVGDGEAADLPLLERTSETARDWTGVAGADAGSDGGDVVVGELAVTEDAGVTGFMRRPLRTAGRGCGDAARDTGAGGSSFSRWACR